MSLGLKNRLKNFQLNLIKIEGVTVIFVIFYFCDFLYQSLDILTQHVISFWNPYLP